MHVIAPRQTWTDERLDDLNQKVDNGFAQVDARFDKLEGKLDKLILVLFTSAVALIGLVGVALL